LGLPAHGDGGRRESGRHGRVGKLLKSESVGSGRLWPLFFMADLIGVIFDVATAIRLKICIPDMDEPIATLRRGARLSAPGPSHDKAATPTRKTSNIHHSERACRKSEDAAHEIIEQALAASRKRSARPA
jgi:hypothetical protein